MATTFPSDRQPDSRIRATALRHARTIEERKRLQAQIADLIVEAYDLPSQTDVDPAKPTIQDLRLFKECLTLFQPSDLDDLIYERNTDDKCGYALCPRPNKKLQHDGQKVWNRMAGKDFKLVDKAELEKWCSRECGERTAFIRAQLSSEPAWLRETQNEGVKLLDEVRQTDELVNALKELSMNGSDNTNVLQRLKALSLERGEADIQNVEDKVSIVERDSDSKPSLPLQQRSSNTIEGHQPKRVRFADGKIRVQESGLS